MAHRGVRIVIAVLWTTFLLTSLLIDSFSAVSAAESVRFDDGWRFRRGDAESAEWRLSPRMIRPQMARMTGNDLLAQGPKKYPYSIISPDGLEWAQPNFDDSGWTPLDLPHDWAIAEAFTREHDPTESYLPCSGTGWYRKTFDVSDQWTGKRIFLDFDGVMSYAAVWLNGEFVGGWPYGYTSFRVDLTPKIRFDAPNVVAVRVAHPRQTSRWYTGGGIYRHVRLTAAEPVRFTHWGVFGRSENVSADSATLQLDATVTNETAHRRDVTVLAVLFRVDSEGERVGESVAAFEPAQGSLEPNETKKIEFSPLILEKPSLWSPETPNLYTIETTLIERGASEKTLDIESIPLGVRRIEFTPNGLFVNGDPTKLRGCCLHHDLGALGAAVNTRAIKRQLEKLREAGCNAIRLSHNPAAPQMMDLLDRLGFLVQAEAFDQWTIPGTGWIPEGYCELFDDWHEKDLRALVRRDRNHPSVVMWSVGNEIPELSSDLPKFIETANRLCRIVKEEDPARPTTSACNRRDAGNNGAQEPFDLFGYNYYGRAAYEEFREKNPNKAVYGSETTCMMSTRGFYLFPVEKKWMRGIADYSHSSYCWQACGWDPDKPLLGWAAPPDIELAIQEKYAWVCGEFIWTGIDYLGAPYYVGELEHSGKLIDPERIRQAQEDRAKYGIPRCPLRICETGLLDTAGFEKDVFWLYRSVWRPDTPTAHLLPHWNWPDRQGEVTPVNLFTSGDEAELFLNGESLGRKKKEEYEYRLCWDDVQYTPGRLEAVVYKNGEPWTQTAVETTGPAAALQLTADRTRLAADGRDLAFVTCDLLDAAGRNVPTANNIVSFSISGGGRIVATDSGDGRDWTPYSATKRKAFAGKTLVIVAIEKGTTGPVTLTVESDNMESSEIVINGNQ